MTKRKTKQRSLAYFYLLINTLVWGASLVIVKPALNLVTPNQYLLYRFFFASAFSLPTLIYYLPKIKNKKQVISKIIPLELLGTTLALWLLYTGLDKTTALEASFLVTTTPIFVTLFGVFFLKEQLEKHEVIGLTTAFIGTILLIFLPIIIQQQTLNNISIVGNLLIVAQNIATASYFILAKKYYQKLPKLFVVSLSFLIGFFSFFIINLVSLDFFIITLIKQSYLNLSQPIVLTASLYMAIFGSIIGLTTYIKGQALIETSEAVLFNYLQPLVYMPLSTILLNETIYPLQLISLTIIILGVYLAEKRS